MNTSVYFDWQPIETAPKDGTRIITYSKGVSSVQKVGVHRWQNNAWMGGDFYNVMFFPDSKDAPTHWVVYEEPITA